MIWSGRRRGTAIAVLSVLALALGSANLIRHGYLTWATLGGHKEELAAAASATNILVVIVGAILSYFRFFRGRTFSTRADLDLSIEVIPLPNGRHLHAVTLRIKNVGNAPIWEPKPVIEIFTLGGAGQQLVETIRDWSDVLEGGDGNLRVAILDTGETGVFVTRREFGGDVWVVTYAARVSCDSGDIWKHIRLVRNASLPAPNTAAPTDQKAPLSGR